MPIKDNIKMLRESRGLTQQELADVLGVDRSAVAQWESGISSPRIGKAMAVCEYFHVTLDNLVNDKPTLSELTRAWTPHDEDLEELTRLYSSLPEEGRKQLLIFARGLMQTYVEKR